MPSKKSLWLFLLPMAITLIFVPYEALAIEKAIDPDSPEFQDAQKDLTKDFVASPEVSHEVARLEEAYPDKGSPVKYSRDGHQFATYIVAMAANLGKERSHELAYFSQFPDDEKRFSAALAFFYLFDLEYRKQIMAVLHSLHGGVHDAVLKRRRDLQALVSDGVQNGQLKDFQIGLIVHALADSYAHTVGEDSELRAFDYTWGHLFHGSKPDLIDHDPEKFKEYTCALYIALSSKQDCQQALKDLHEIIDHLAFSRNDALPQFEKYAYKKEFDQQFYKALNKSWKNKVDKAAVKHTIELIEARTRDEQASQKK